MNSIGGYFKDESVVKQSGILLSRILVKEIKFFREIDEKKSDLYRNLRFRIIDLVKNFDTENSG